MKFLHSPWLEAAVGLTQPCKYRNYNFPINKVNDLDNGKNQSCMTRRCILMDGKKRHPTHRCEICNFVRFDQIILEPNKNIIDPVGRCGCIDYNGFGYKRPSASIFPG